MTDDLPRPAKAPCGSCPYRRDAPSGLWHPDEYAKLLNYDGPTVFQSPALFLCHQKDGNLCAGWLACHDPDELLALRVSEVHEDAYSYRSPVPVFTSGAEAAAHGMKDIDNPGRAAVRTMVKIERKRAKSRRAARQL
jgi:Family of unknown function (DUF6283)